MDQNQPVDNDLQKAIDDITNTTNIDPVFSDPVAAPSSVPEGDSGELDEAVGPFPAPAPKVEAVMPPAEPIAPLQAMEIPELSMPDIAPPTPMTTPDSILPPAPDPEPMPAPEPTPEPSPKALNTREIKQAALRDLVPLLDHLSNMEPIQKFKIYRDIFDDLKDYTVLEPAYKAAKQITDDSTRADALLYIVESIDKM